MLNPLATSAVSAATVSAFRTVEELLATSTNVTLVVFPLLATVKLTSRVIWSESDVARRTFKD